MKPKQKTQQKKNKTSNHVVLGCFASAYGVRGWVRVNSYTTPKENLLNYPVWQTKHDKQIESIKISRSKFHSNQLIIKIDGCDDRETAKTYTNCPIMINRTELPTLPENEYYWTDLIGLSVITKEGINLGRVDSLIETGSNDVLIVIDEEQERLLPYTNQVIISINLADKIMVVDWDPDF